MLPSSLQLIPPADTVLPSTPSGNLRSAAASSDHLREIRRAKLCLQPQWSHPEAVHLYPFTILPKRPGLPCFLGRFAPAASAWCRRGNAVPRAADVLLQQRDALGCSHGTTEAGFGFAGSTESCQGWKVRVAEGSQHGQTQTCVCTSHHKAAAR